MSFINAGFRSDTSLPLAPVVSGFRSDTRLGVILSGFRSDSNLKAGMMSGFHSDTHRWPGFINAALHPPTTPYDPTTTPVTGSDPGETGGGGGTAGSGGGGGGGGSGSGHFGFGGAGSGGTSSYNPSASDSGSSGYELALIPPEVRASIKLSTTDGSVDLSPYLKSIDIDLNLGSVSSFTATFIHHSPPLPINEDLDTPTRSIAVIPSELDALHRGKTIFDKLIVQHKYDGTRYFNITLHITKGPDEVIYQLPLFAPGTPRWDGEELQWGGQDLTVALDIEQPNAIPGIVILTAPLFPDIIPTGAPAFAHETIKTVCGHYGINNVRLDFPDYRIRQLRRMGSTPRSWVEAICKPYQALMRWEGTTLVFAPVKETIKEKFLLVEELTIEQLTITQKDDWHNKFTISRLEDGGGVYGSAFCAPGPACPGRTVHISLSEPINAVDLVVKVYGDCSITDYVYFNEADQPMGVIPGGGFEPGTQYYRGGQKVKRIEASCVPTYANAGNQISTLPRTVGGTMVIVSSGGNLGNIVGYDITAHGGNTTGVFDTHYAFTASDADTVALYGLRADFENIEDPIIPTSAVAQDYLKAVLATNMRKIWDANILTENVIPILTPGDTIATTDYLTRQDKVKWIAERIRIAYDEGNLWQMSIDMTRGLIT